MQLSTKSVIISYWAIVVLLPEVFCCSPWSRYHKLNSDEPRNEMIGGNKEKRSDDSFTDPEPDPDGQDEVHDLKISKDIVGEDKELEENNAENETRESYDDVPEELDWRQKGYVTPVGNQMPCNCCCWAFAVAGTIEGLLKKETGQLIDLSEQNLVDCMKDFMGLPECPGGENAPNVFEYVQKYGIATADSQPYTGLVSGTCYHSPDSINIIIHNYQQVLVGDEEALKLTIATFGPVAVNIDSKPKDFIHYKRGIYKGPCYNEMNDLNHEMLAVGYGHENGQGYWILKNSWGNKWGEQGYMRLARNSGNLCGIATNAYYVT